MLYEASWAAAEWLVQSWLSRIRQIWCVWHGCCSVDSCIDKDHCVSWILLLSVCFSSLFLKRFSSPDRCFVDNVDWQTENPTEQFAVSCFFTSQHKSPAWWLQWPILCIFTDFINFSAYKMSQALCICHTYHVSTPDLRIFCVCPTYSLWIFLT